jgi:hypothetical protein
MAAFLSTMRERGPQLWGLRLLLGISLLTMIMAGVWQGEFHSHDNAGTSHTHAPDHDSHGLDPHPDSSDSDVPHFHDAASSVAMFGPPAYDNGWPDIPVIWVPDHPAAQAPPVALNTPHRPPIA